MRWTTLALVLGAGCGPSEGKYVARYVDAECAYALACYDEAILSFYSWDSEEACVSSRGPEVAAQVDGCAAFNRRAAKQCLKELEDLGCPPEGEEPTLPLICNSVYTDCDAGETDGGTDDTDGGTQDTDEGI